MPPWLLFAVVVLASGVWCGDSRGGCVPLSYCHDITCLCCHGCFCCCSMLTGATIEVSSTPLPRAVPFTSATAGGRGEVADNALPATSSTDSEDRGRVNSWQQQQQKFAAAAAEKKDKKPGYAFQPQQPTLTNETCPAAGAGAGPDSSSGGGWDDDGVVTAEAAAAAAPAVPAAADRSWRASYASSLYCLLPAWLLRFRRTGYSPLRDGSCTAAASSSSPAAASCNRSSSAPAGGSGCAATGAETQSFGDAPFSTVCLHCHKAITTTVAFRISCIGICLCVLSPLLLGWPGLCLSPFIYVALKDAVHTCPHCRNLVHRQSRVSVPFCGLRDEVVTVKCGSCAVVLSRRYLLLFTGLLLLILVFYVLRVGWLGSSLDVIPKGPPTNLSWQQFYEQCGQRSQLGNSLKAGANFRDSYAGKTVKWKGLVKQVKEGLFSSNVLFLIMSPTITVPGGSQISLTGEGDLNGKGSSDSTSSADKREGDSEDVTGSFVQRGGVREGGKAGMKSEDGRSNTDGSGPEEDEDLEEEARALQGDGADLALAFNGRELAAKIEKLEPGDRVEFEATLVALGRRGKPSLGRLWDVTVVEKREARQARLEEWRAKKAERQHLLHRLLLPIIGSPFSDFGGFDPFGSLFSSAGGMGGSGVMVIRRQIISPATTFSVISSSAGDESGPTTITSSFESGGGISIGGSHRGNEDEEEKRHSGSSSSGGGHEDVADLLAGLGGVRHGSAVGKRFEAVGRFGGGSLADEDGRYVLRVEDEGEEDRLRGILGGRSHFGHEQAKTRSHGMPTWSAHIVDDDEEMHWHEVPEDRHGGDDLYFGMKDDVQDLQPNAFPEHRDSTVESTQHGTAAAAPGSAPAAAVEHQEERQQRQHSHEGDEDEGENDPTLAALKAAVELQRQRRAQQEEQAREQRQRQQTQQDRQKQQVHAQREEQQQQREGGHVEEKDWGKSTAEAPAKTPVTGAGRDRLQPPQGAQWMHGDEAFDTHDAGGPAADAHLDHDPYAEVPLELNQPEQTQGVQKQQQPATYAGGAAAQGGTAHVQHDQQGPGAAAQAAPSEGSSAADPGTKQP